MLVGMVGLCVICLLLGVVIVCVGVVLMLD